MRPGCRRPWSARTTTTAGSGAGRFGSWFGDEPSGCVPTGDWPEHGRRKPQYGQKQRCEQAIEAVSPPHPGHGQDCGGQQTRILRPGSHQRRCGGASQQGGQAVERRRAPQHPAQPSNAPGTPATKMRQREEVPAQSRGLREWQPENSPRRSRSHRRIPPFSMLSSMALTSGAIRGGGAASMASVTACRSSGFKFCHSSLKVPHFLSIAGDQRRPFLHIGGEQHI